MSNPTDSFFGGAEGLSWPKANGQHVYDDVRLRGVIRGGVIVDDPKLEVMTEMSTGATIYWDPAERTRPKQQLVVTLRCDGSRGGALDERKDAIDDGKRRLYIRGYMVAAVREALQRVSAPGLRQGGELYVVWIDEKPSKTKGFDPARVWAANYVPPSVTVPDGGASAQPTQGLSGAPAANPFGAAQQPAAPAAPAQQQQQPPAAPAPAGNPWGQPLPAPAPANAPAANPWG
jgi:hypothetical protein